MLSPIIAKSHDQEIPDYYRGMLSLLTGDAEMVAHVPLDAELDHEQEIPDYHREVLSPIFAEIHYSEVLNPSFDH